MNRINAMINAYTTITAKCLIYVIELGSDGFFEEAADLTDMMLKARHHMEMWVSISQAIRGWQV